MLHPNQELEPPANPARFKPSDKDTPIMMMKTRYEPHQIQHGQETLQAFLDDLKALDVLPMPQPAGMEPATYMCAANMDAMMVSFDDGDLVADIAFRNVPPGCPELLGIRRADHSCDLDAAREIGRSLILDVLYGMIVPSDVPLLSDTETAKTDRKDSAYFMDLQDQPTTKSGKVVVTCAGNRYEVFRKYMQRPLSQSELQHLKDIEESDARRRELQGKPAIISNEEIEAANLDAFYCALADAGITGIVGYHDLFDEDRGRFAGIRVIRAQRLVELPALNVQWASKDDEGRQGYTFEKAGLLALADIVINIFSDIQMEYCLEPGTYFQFRCDVATRKFHIKASGYDLEDAFLELDLVC